MMTIFDTEADVGQMVVWMIRWFAAVILSALVTGSVLAIIGATVWAIMRIG